MDLGRSEDGRLYIAMDLVVGVTVSRLLRNLVDSGEPFPPDLARRFWLSCGGFYKLMLRPRRPESRCRSASGCVIQNLLVGIDGRFKDYRLRSRSGDAANHADGGTFQGQVQLFGAGAVARS